MVGIISYFMVPLVFLSSLKTQGLSTTVIWRGLGLFKNLGFDYPDVVAFDLRLQSVPGLYSGLDSFVLPNPVVRAGTSDQYKLPPPGLYPPLGTQNASWIASVALSRSLCEKSFRP